jgi:hypothetical protein
MFKQASAVAPGTLPAKFNFPKRPFRAVKTV